MGKKKIVRGGGVGHPIAQNVNIILKNHKKYSYIKEILIMTCS